MGRAKLELLARLMEAMRYGVRVAIDCSLEQTMRDLELRDLARQLLRAYGSNRRALKPFHLHLTGLRPDGRLHQAFNTYVPHFRDLLITVSERQYYEVFSADEVIYLSPDSSNVLELLEQRRVYVLGGLVDKSIKKGLTEKRARKFGIRTARLPVMEHMERLSNPGHLNLSINQVIDILLSVHNDGDWVQALARNIAKRKGYVLKADSS